MKSFEALPTVKALIGALPQDMKTDSQSAISTKLDARKLISILSEADIDINQMKSPDSTMTYAAYLAEYKDGAVITKDAWEQIVTKLGFDNLLKNPKNYFSYTEYSGKEFKGNSAGDLLFQLTQAMRSELGRPTCTCSDAHALSDYLKMKSV